MHRGSRPISYQAIASSNLGQKTYLDNNKTGLRSGRCYYLDSLLDVVVFAQLQLLLLPRLWDVEHNPIPGPQPGSTLSWDTSKGGACCTGLLPVSSKTLC